MPVDPIHAGRVPSRGRCFLYVFPCGWEDLLKLGISRDPLDRLQALHPRWFDLFDPGRGFLVEFDRVRDARDRELELGHRLAAHRAVAPLTVRVAAGGHTEWFRGASPALDEAMQALAAQGHVVHAPLRPWLRAALQARCALLYAWTQAMLDADDLAARDAASPRRQAVRDALDAFAALEIDLAPLLPDAVLAWYRGLRD
ncbi:MAG: GIY-YIG nuclease family protein [Lysobacter sp.]|nr:GIY-YIG nuclease family protein [Lysobacter sp.]